jgi:hypothetical protein
MDAASLFVVADGMNHAATVASHHGRVDTGVHLGHQDSLEH